MVKVLYNSKTNAILGGVLFLDGVAEFTDDKEGIKFAEMFYLKYEVIAVETIKAPTKKKVSK